MHFTQRILPFLTPPQPVGELLIIVMVVFALVRRGWNLCLLSEGCIVAALIYRVADGLMPAGPKAHPGSEVTAARSPRDGLPRLLRVRCPVCFVQWNVVEARWSLRCGLKWPRSSGLPTGGAERHHPRAPRGHVGQNQAHHQHQLPGL